MTMAEPRFQRARFLRGTVAIGAGAMLLSACANAPGQKGRILDGEASYRDAVGVYTNPEADPSGHDPIAAAAYWGTRFDSDPQDAEAAVRYSGALRKIGSVKEAVSVSSKAIQRHPDNPGVNLELGKALTEDGRAFEAVRHFEIAIAERAGDWRAYSAYGVALDQIGEHEVARDQYDRALQLAPDAVSVMSNKGMSYAMSGDLGAAVATLRAAAASRRADARIRQNLALVLAIKGDYAEAVRLARSDLPPQLAEQNAQYFRTLLNQPAYWQEFAADSVDAPVFDAPPPPAAPAAPTQKPEPLREEPKTQEPDRDGPVALGRQGVQSPTPAALETVEPAETTETGPSEADLEERLRAAPDLKN